VVCMKGMIGGVPVRTALYNIKDLFLVVSLFISGIPAHLLFGCARAGWRETLVVSGTRVLVPGCARDSGMCVPSCERGSCVCPFFLFFFIFLLKNS
jgi:hypothetical protein